MSDVAQGEGWWIASDGRWYPPELHPFFARPVPPLPPVPPVPSRRTGRRAIIGTAVALTAVALGATILAVVSPNPSSGGGSTHGAAPVYIAPLTGFGGYRLIEDDDVSQISGQWQVPAITAKSPAGHASTWIGAQGFGGDASFIQVGVTEDSFGSGQSLYEEFWSDPAVSYHPQSLGEVSAGDLISFSMQHQNQGWSLSVDDRTTKSAVTKLIHYGIGGSFTTGEWIQEDPTDTAAAAVDLPYPETSTVTFQQLSINGRPPELDLADGQTLERGRRDHPRPERAPPRLLLAGRTDRGGRPVPAGCGRSGRRPVALQRRAGLVECEVPSHPIGRRRQTLGRLRQ